MFRRVLVLLIMITAFVSCKEDCYSAPESVFFKLVDASGNNLLENGTLTFYTIQMEVNSTTTTNITATKTTDNRLELTKVGDFNGERNYRLYSNIDFFDFKIKASPITTDCEGYKIDSVVFENNLPVSQSGNEYTITLD